MGIEPLVHDDLTKFVTLATETEIPILQRHIARRVASLPDPEEGLGVLLGILAERAIPEAFQGMLTGLDGRNDVKMPPNWGEAAKTLSQDPKLANRVLELGVSFGDPESFAKLRALAEEESASASDRQRALDRLLQNRTEGQAEWLLSQLSSPVLQRNSLRGLAGFQSPKIAPKIVGAYSTFPNAKTRQDALQTLATRASWANQMLDAVESGQIPRADLTAYTMRQIQSLGDNELNDRITQLWGIVSTTPAQKQKRIDYHVKDLSDELHLAELPEGRQLYQTLLRRLPQVIWRRRRFRSGFDRRAALQPGLPGGKHHRAQRIRRQGLPDANHRADGWSNSHGIFLRRIRNNGHHSHPERNVGHAQGSD